MVRESLDIVAGDQPAGDGHLHLQLCHIKNEPCTTEIYLQFTCACHLQLHRREELLPGVPDCDVQD